MLISLYSFNTNLKQTVTLTKLNEIAAITRNNLPDYVNKLSCIGIKKHCEMSSFHITIT